MSVQGFFGSGSGGAAGETPALHSFRAGKLNATKVEGGGGKLRLVADARKGAIQMVKGDDGLLWFRWMDRTTKVVEQNLMVLPGSATFEKIESGREGDRVFMLQFTEGERRHFFWMQEPLAEKDEANAKRVNDLIADPSAPAPGAAGAAGGNPADMQALLSGLMGGRMPSGPRGAAMAQQLQAAMADPRMAGQLSALLGGAAPGGGGGGGGASAGGGAAAGSGAGASGGGAADAMGGGFADEEAQLQAVLMASMQQSAPPPAPPASASSGSGAAASGSSASGSGSASGEGGAASNSGSGSGAAAESGDGDDDADMYADDSAGASGSGSGTSGSGGGNSGSGTGSGTGGGGSGGASSS